MFRLTSLNLNGVRSAVNKGLEKWVEKTAPDCMCVQEIKAQSGDLEGRLDRIAGLRGYFQCAEKKGYSGVGLYSRHEPSSVVVGFDGGEFDAEGRYVELRFDTLRAKRSIISCYFPSGSSGPERQAAKYRFLDAIYPHLVRLQQGRDFILCGDINIAHHPRDLKNWRGNLKNSGFLPQERAWLNKLTTLNPTFDETQRAASDSGNGLIDVYRRLHPDATETCYTWWSNRGQAYANNVGWRLDYHLATPALAGLAQEAVIDKSEKFSDHAPLSITYDLVL